MTKPVTEKLEKMQITITDIEEKRKNLKSNVQNLMRDIAQREQEINTMKTDLVRLQGAIAMCDELINNGVKNDS